MFRLRTSIGLSLLALGIGIAGTSWLSTLTAGWPGPTPQVASRAHRPASPARLAPAPAPAQRRAVAAVVRRARPAPLLPLAVAASPVDEAPAELVPLATPADTSRSWDAMYGHLDGRTVVHVSVDGAGRVTAASLVHSSGDLILDEYALRSVQRWRFAVPPNHPDGVSGDLPMRFSSHGGALARVP